MTHDLVESDASQPYPCLGLATWIGDQHDGLPGTDHIAGVLREASLHADIDRSHQVPRAKDLRIASVEDHATFRDDRENLIDGEHLRRRLVVEQAPGPAVRVGGKAEIGGRSRLALGHDGHELVLGHRGKGIVAPTLLADCRLGRGRELLAACGTGAVRRVDPRAVGKGQDLFLQRAVQRPTHVVSTPADRGEEVGSADIAQEQGVTGEHGPGLGVIGMLPDHQ